MFSKLFGGKKGGGAERADAFITALKSQLGINDTQAASIENVMREFFQSRKMHKQSGNKEGMQQARQKMMENMQSVLTPDQMQKFNANIEQFKSIIKS